MSIADTGVSVVDEQARLGKRRAGQEAADKAAAKKRGGGSSSKRGAKSKASRGKTNSKAKAGRIAGKAGRGRGAQAQVHKNRSGAQKTIVYAIKKDGARLISGNAGITVKDILSSFKLASSSRLDIQKDTMHLSLSLPNSDSWAGWMSDIELAEAVDIIRAELGLDDGFPFCVGLHTDSDSLHIHYAGSRISYDGRIIDDRFIKVRMARIEDLIEDKFRLRIVPKKDYIDAPSYMAGEAAIAAVAGIKPPRFVVHEAIKEALKDKPDIISFIEKLEIQGIKARPAISDPKAGEDKQGKMSGFSFNYSGVSFKASSISSSFGWNKLKEKLNYEPNQHDKKLAIIRDKATASGVFEVEKPAQNNNEPVQQLSQVIQQTEPTITGFTEEIPKPATQNRNTGNSFDNSNNNCSSSCKLDDFDRRRHVVEATPYDLELSNVLRAITRKRLFPERENVLSKLAEVVASDSNPKRVTMAKALIKCSNENDSKEDIRKAFILQFGFSQESKDFFDEFIKIGGMGEGERGRTRTREQDAYARRMAEADKYDQSIEVAQTNSSLSLPKF